MRARYDQLDELPVGRSGGESLDRRRREIGCARSGLGNDEKLLVVEPRALGGFPARPAVVARLNLAALHGEIDLVAAGVATDDLEPGPEQLVHQRRIRVRDGAAG